MTPLFDQLLLLASCIPLFLHWMPQTALLHVLALLSSVIFLSLCRCCNLEALSLWQLPARSRIPLILLWLSLAIASLLHPAFGFLLPLLFYELSLTFHSYFYIAACLLPFFSLRAEQPFYPWMILLLHFLAWILSQRTKALLQLKRDFRLLRDTSVEYQLLLQQKNRDLVEKQNHEIHIATLKERNRIAREIHDNVGHMLSRSILQSGALMAINRQENLNEPLKALKDTLCQAMDSIRQSVHNLHDDSIDLKSAIQNLCADFSDYQIRLDYDISRFIPSEVKYCFIAITKEALSNTARHSNADTISITLREHPRFYQLMVADNGTGTGTASKTASGSRTAAEEWTASASRIGAAMNPASKGMGLANMRERAESLKGHFSLSTEHGFCIFVSIPCQPDHKADKSASIP